MKAQSVQITLYHFDDFHHREACVWHDQDHKAEVIGRMPEVYLSQRWVAPPELIAVRPTSTLEHHGGEYVNMYWSSSTPAKLQADFDVFSREFYELGRMEPYRYMHSLWRRRLRPVSGSTRSAYPLSAEAVACAVQNTGLLVTLARTLSTPKQSEYVHWHDSVHVPGVLETGLFNGAVKLISDEPDDQGLFVMFYYTDRPDPTQVYAEYLRFVADTTGPSGVFPGADAYQLLHNGMYRPSIGFYDYYQ